MSSPRFVILRGFQTSSRREKEREIGGESHEENSPIKSIPHHHEKDIIIRPNAGAAIDRSSPRPRPGGDGAQRKKERKKERKSALVDFPTTSLTKKHPSKERERHTHIFPSSSSSPIPIASYKRTTHIGVKNKHGRRRRRCTYQSQLHLSVEKEKAEPREEREERVRDHLSLSLFLFLSR